MNSMSKPVGASHLEKCFGLVHISNIVSSGASNVRLMTNCSLPDDSFSRYSASRSQVRVAARLLDELASLLGRLGRRQASCSCPSWSCRPSQRTAPSRGTSAADRRCRRGRRPASRALRLRNTASCSGNRCRRGRASCRPSGRPAARSLLCVVSVKPRGPHHWADLLGIGPGVPHGLDRRIVDPSDVDLVRFIFCGHSSFLSHFSLTVTVFK